MAGERKAGACARILARLEGQAEDVRRLVAGLGEAALSTRTKPESWSVKELLCHLLRIQQVFERRLERPLVTRPWAESLA
jgi:hypothetical protein